MIGLAASHLTRFHAAPAQAADEALEAGPGYALAAVLVAIAVTASAIIGAWATVRDFGEVAFAAFILATLFVLSGYWVTRIALAGVGAFVGAKVLTAGSASLAALVTLGRTLIEVFFILGAAYIWAGGETEIDQADLVSLSPELISFEIVYALACARFFAAVLAAPIATGGAAIGLTLALADTVLSLGLGWGLSQLAQSASEAASP